MNIASTWNLCWSHMALFQQCSKLIGRASLEHKVAHQGLHGSFRHGSTFLDFGTYIKENRNIMRSFIYKNESNNSTCHFIGHTMMRSAIHQNLGDKLAQLEISRINPYILGSQWSKVSRGRQHDFRCFLDVLGHIEQIVEKPRGSTNGAIHELYHY